MARVRLSQSRTARRRLRRKQLRPRGITSRLRRLLQRRARRRRRRSASNIATMRDLMVLYGGRAIVCAGVLCWTAMASCVAQAPTANPARPTMTNPATLPPVGYLQLEQGYLGSFDSPATDSQHGIDLVVKTAVHPRLMLELQ